MVIFKYEMKKAFKQRAYWIALAIMLLILLTNELTPIFLGNFGPRLQTEKSLSGTIIDDTYLASVTDAGTDSNDPLVFFIKGCTAAGDITGYTAKELYDRRTEINTRLMESDGLSDSVIAKWLKLDSENRTPFTYYYCGSYVAYMEIAGYINFMILILCAIGLSGIFADERTNKTDQLIFCTKTGKTSLFRIKLVTGMLLGLFTAVVLVTFELVLTAVLFGTKGADTMIQLLLPQCMMHLTMGQAACIMTIFFLLEALVLSVISMAVSQITMNHVVSMAVMILIMFIAMFNIPSKLGILYILWNSVPGAAVGSWMFTDYHMIELFGHQIINFAYLPVLWSAAGAVMLLLSRAFYRTYEVKAQ